jgi:DNA-binding SARP family transcriptional activator
MLGQHGQLAGELETWCRQHPLRERLWELLILALYRAGRQAEALGAYTEVRDRLVDELGLDPGPALRELEARILAQDPTLSPSSPKPPCRRSVLRHDDKQGAHGVAVKAGTIAPAATSSQDRDVDRPGNPGSREHPRDGRAYGPSAFRPS